MGYSSLVGELYEQINGPGGLAAAAITAGLGQAFTGTVLGGNGDNLNVYATASTARLIDLRAGTAAAPDTTTNPLAKVQRTVNVSHTAITGDGSEALTAIEGINAGTSANEVQTVGVLGAATNSGTVVNSPISPDACGLYGVGRILGSGAGVGIGAFFVGRTDSTAGKASGGQISLYNGTGSDHTVNATGFSTTNAWWITSSGPNKAAVGVELGNPAGSQFDVGLHFNGQLAGGLTGPTATADIQSDSTALTAVLINGTHSTAAIAVKAGSGPVVVGGTARITTGALIEVQGPAADTDPLVMVGSSTNNKNYSVRIRNSAAQHAWFIANAPNLFLTGTAAGDAGFSVPTTGTTFHVGGTASVIKVNNSNQLGFFNVTAVAQPSAAGTATGYAAGATAATFHSDDTYTGNTGTTGYTINGLVAALKNLGLIHT